uniref:Methyltransferase small domain-containing protein n=1 Tax=Odontella aurita TaxID=265563 RepID=A0A7S4K3H1_9STRA|mmetsp:Transcript_59922/g.177675  ORF Transcript_59922/g.177675 Transcript_59922/m.177675 type:complete len:523 (+) Transcript_59922:79-1647(+)
MRSGRPLRGDSETLTVLESQSSVVTTRNAEAMTYHGAIAVIAMISSCAPTAAARLSPGFSASFPTGRAIRRPARSSSIGPHRALGRIPQQQPPVVCEAGRQDNFLRIGRRRADFRGSGGTCSPTHARFVPPARRLYLSPSSSFDGAGHPRGYFSSTKGPGLPPLAGRTVSETLRLAVEILKSRSVPEADWSAVQLLSDSLGLEWDGGYRDLLRLLEAPESSALPEVEGRVLSEDEARVFSSHISRRLSMEPLQYILGRWDFLDFTLKVCPPCLCPRPETEELVEYAAESAREIFLRREARALLDKREIGTKKVRILDVGCGTGAIGLALARIFGPDEVEVVAIDMEDIAVELSNENAKDLLYCNQKADPDTKSCWYKATLCSAADFSNSADTVGDRPLYEFGFDLVVSNPPYIPRLDMATLTDDVVGFESDAALCGGDDGLDVVRDIVSRLPEWSAEGGCDCWMEVDTSHPSMIAEWLQGGAEREEICEDVTKSQGSPKVEFIRGIKDMSGRDRFVQLRLEL